MNFVDTVPPPACNVNNVGVYQPIAKCSDIFYLCTTATAQPLFDVCITSPIIFKTPIFGYNMLFEINSKTVKLQFNATIT